MRGREVGGQALERELESRVENGCAHTLASLPNGRVGEPDNGEHGQSRPDVDLDRDLTAVDAFECECGDACEHAANLRGSALRRWYLRNDSVTG